MMIIGCHIQEQEWNTHAEFKTLTTQTGFELLKFDYTHLLTIVIMFTFSIKFLIFLNTILEYKIYKYIIIFIDINQISK